MLGQSAKYATVNTNYAHHAQTLYGDETCVVDTADTLDSFA